MVGRRCPWEVALFHKYVLDHEVDEQRIVEAIEYVKQRHPLPFCQITKTANGQYVWQESNFEPSQLINGRSPEPQELAPRIHIDREPGIRLWHTGSAIWFEYHHMCADGRGALQLERDFFKRYAFEQQAVIVHANDATEVSDTWEKLRHRSRTRITLGGAFWRGIFAWAYTWRGFNTIVMPFPGAQPSRADHVAITVYTRRLTAMATRETRQRVKKLRITLNDWILIQVAHSIAERIPNRANEDRVIRLIVPIDMRPAHGNLLTCANKMSFLYLDIPQARIDASPASFRWISKRMRFRKKHMGLVVWRCLQFGPKKTADMRTYLERRTNMMTCYVSNLGIVDGLPAFVEGFEATPPLWRQDTPYALMATLFVNSCI